ncbi:lipoprotein insertase outer membrane protein LolB [Amphritea balenae]|uniref:Outer-membrane lipoprotein LolB n=1 Tax=Amphritea balenae TaxID=452629 RepID=A0A3P1SR51_9GAMM|nr:lipoprotein insertase outer membrane protein LolB [Amphritea balenae]RRC99627.1 outer membrane lipoprotein LolB [Amphritea balenae]GGK78492.1 outer-membrane lipoprotein LolB [Amphritea balenae]
MFRSLFVLFIILLSGCSALNLTPTEEVDTALNQRPWQQQQAMILAAERWRLKGKIGIRTATDNSSASLYWQQLQQHYEIELTGPLGQGGARIEGNGAGITIDVAGEKPIWAPSPELLMEQTLGWQFPVRELLYWVKGVPAPGTPFELSLSQELPEKITQNNWQINYLRFTEQSGYQLPGKLTINRDDLRITIVAKEWQILH